MRRAIDKLDNTELNGRRLRLIEDKPSSSSKRRNKLAPFELHLWLRLSFGYFHIPDPKFDIWKSGC